MSDPTGDYSFAGLGFNGLRFMLVDGQYSGTLYYGQGSTTPISGATYTDNPGVVTFGAAQSPAGIIDLNFTGNIILGQSGVIAIAGTWTGRHRLVVGSEEAVAQAEPVDKGIIPHPIPVLQVNGSWAAFNRQNIIA